jgi:hypothetical protein
MQQYTDNVYQIRLELFMFGILTKQDAKSTTVSMATVLIVVYMVPILQNYSLNPSYC